MNLKSNLSTDLGDIIMLKGPEGPLNQMIGLRAFGIVKQRLVVYRTQIFRFGAETEQPNIFKKCSAEYRTEPNIFGNKHDLLLLTCCGAVIKRRQFENAALLC